MKMELINTIPEMILSYIAICYGAFLLISFVLKDRLVMSIEFILKEHDIDLTTKNINFFILFAFFTFPLVVIIYTLREIYAMFYFLLYQQFPFDD